MPKQIGEMVQYLRFTSILLLHAFIKFLFIFVDRKIAVIYQGASVPGLAHGKMYKRATFGASCPSLRSRFGIARDDIKYSQSEK